MKRFFACLLMIAVLSFSMVNMGICEDSLQLVEVNDGIFSYSVPSSWIATTSNSNGYNYHYFFAQREGSADGGYLMEFVADIGQTIPDSFLQTSYQSLVDGVFPEETNYTSESVVICERPTIKYYGDYKMEDSTEVLHGLAVETNGCVLQMMYINPTASFEENNKFLETIMQTIKVSKNDTIYDYCVDLMGEPSSVSEIDIVSENSDEAARIGVYSDPYSLMVMMYWDGQSFAWFDATFDDFYQIVRDYPEASFDINVQDFTRDEDALKFMSQLSE